MLFGLLLKLLVGLTIVLCCCVCGLLFIWFIAYVLDIIVVILCL